MLVFVVVVFVVVDGYSGGRDDDDDELCGWNGGDGWLTCEGVVLKADERLFKYCIIICGASSLTSCVKTLFCCGKRGNSWNVTWYTYLEGGPVEGRRSVQRKACGPFEGDSKRW